MTNAPTTRVAPHFQALDQEEAAEMTDEQLLDSFLHGGTDAAQAAFRSLVVRHGPMVLGVCRHVLVQHQDAEDAFQATFLILARRAGSIRNHRVLARWLYEVAYRIAVRARVNSQRRRDHERQVAEMSVTVPDENLAWSELRPVLHDELSRLPAKYRSPMILCYLEGKTNEEAAQLLQWPVGTVKGRLARARELLRARLTRRGLALSAAFLAFILRQNHVLAEAVPSRLVDKTVRSALAIKASPASATASATVPDRVQVLMEPLPRTDRRLRIALATGLLLLIGAGLSRAAVASGLIDGPGLSHQSAMFLWRFERYFATNGNGPCHAVDAARSGR